MGLDNTVSILTGQNYSYRKDDVICTNSGLYFFIPSMNAIQNEVNGALNNLLLNWLIIPDNEFHTDHVSKSLHCTGVVLGNEIRYDLAPWSTC